MVIRGTGLITPPPLQLPPPAPPVPTTVSTDVWLATDNPLAPQVAVADPLQFPNDAVENAVTHEILVADSYNARVLRFNSVTGIFAGEVGLPGTFQLPYGLCVDAAGNILVADLGLSKVLAFDSSGASLGDINWDFNWDTQGGFNQPWSVIFTPGSTLGDGLATSRILVVDAGHDRVLTFGTDGGFIGTFGSPGSVSPENPAHGQFDGPVDIAIRPVSGTDPVTNQLYAYPFQVYIADSANSRIQVLTPDGIWLAEITGLLGPNGVAVDASGRVVVADTFHDRIAVFTPYPDFVPVAAEIGYPSGGGLSGGPFQCDPGGPGFATLPDGTVDPTLCAPGALQTPVNISLDSTGRLIIVDTVNQRIVRFKHPPISVTAAATTATVTAGSQITVHVVAAAAAQSFPTVSTTVTTACVDTSGASVDCATVLIGTPTPTPASGPVSPGAPFQFTVIYDTRADVIDKAVRFAATVCTGTVTANVCDAVSATSIPSDPVDVGFSGTPLVSAVAFNPPLPATGWWLHTAPGITLTSSGTFTSETIVWALIGNGLQAPAAASLHECDLSTGPCTPTIDGEMSLFLWFQARNALQTEQSWHTVPIKVEQTGVTIGIGSQVPSPCATCAGWVNADVVVTYVISNSISGIKTITPAPPVVNGQSVSELTASGEGPAVSTPTLTVVDNAGLGDTVTLTYKIDKTPPVIALGATLNKSAAASGWYNISTGAPTVTFTATDALSGFSAAQASNGVEGSLNATLAMPIGEGANQGATAGPNSFADLAQSATVSGAHATFASGTLTLTCPSCTVPGGATITRQTAGFVVGGLKVDVTLPTFTVSAPVNAYTGATFGGQNGWLDLSGVAANVGATTNVTASDLIPVTGLPGSGVQTVCFNLTPTGTTCTAATLTAGVYSFTVLTAGVTNGSIWVVDVAGNQTPAVPFSLKINRFAPVFTTATLSRSTFEDTALTTTVTATDADAGDVVTYTFPATTANGGTLTAINTAGAYTYTPPANFYGTDTFTVSASDGKSANPTSATVTITVTAVNDVPTFAMGPNVTSNEDAGPQTVTGWATGISAGPANETNGACSPLVPATCQQVVNFIVSSTSTNPALFSAAPAIAANGTLTYTSAPNANGVATVTVSLHDNGGTANSGADTTTPQTFTITVTAVDDAPVAASQSITTNEDTATAISLSATDIDSGTLTYIIVNGPAQDRKSVV